MAAAAQVSIKRLNYDARNTLSGLQCNMFTVELDFINPSAVITFTAQVVIMRNEDSHSLKDPEGPEDRRKEGR